MLPGQLLREHVRHLAESVLIASAYCARRKSQSDAEAKLVLRILRFRAVVIDAVRDTVPSVAETSNCTLLSCVEQHAIYRPHAHSRTVACVSLVGEPDGRPAVVSVFWFKMGHDPEPVPQTFCHSVFQ